MGCPATWRSKSDTAYGQFLYLAVVDGVQCTLFITRPPGNAVHCTIIQCTLYIRLSPGTAGPPRAGPSSSVTCLPPPPRTGSSSWWGTSPPSPTSRCPPPSLLALAPVPKVGVNIKDGGKWAMLGMDSKEGGEAVIKGLHLYEVQLAQPPLGIPIPRQLWGQLLEICLIW